MFGLLGSLFGCNNRDEWNRRPNITSISIEFSIPPGSTPEQISEIQQRVHEHSQLLTMSKAEQLKYLKNKNGL